MMMSMTGFGMFSQNAGKTHVRVELKSVNHRFFDFSLNCPRPLIYLEDQIREIVHSFVKRGSVSLFLSVKGSEAFNPQIETNWSVVDQYISAAQEIQKRSGAQILDISSILQLPGVFSLRDADSLSARTVEPLVLETVRGACVQLKTMREKEGEALRRDLMEKAGCIRMEVRSLEAFMPEVRTHFEHKLRDAVSDFLKQHQAIDEDRLMNEIALFANKSAVDEELTRMKSHLTQFRGFLEDGQDDPVGRRLDFLIQEMNREMNTIGSKGNHAEVSRFVVLVKSEIEKLREQVQNVE
ncbi:YicC/YloC family endoribonuclease [Sporolactobacillus laevolacticus]|uniref:YicC/YloC family endoribonuclease n=1 Tax=Sporolactobacillus laevolacticus TaxID=33018 RepID=UPI0025B35290|nr:YicC/YloC family endoribonuclease [Sporolactobacillus laevolacticus]MDN3954048.1 YicC/YloC family endoribonuclease [Sporolactobacillus laevolacticus]